MQKLLDSCAQALIDTTPQILQTIRVEMRRGRGADISIPQFRTLRFIQRHPDSSLSGLAEHLGLTLPSVSKLVDGLVKQQLLSRKESAEDRRKITLLLTEMGTSIVDSARADARTNLVKKLKHLSDDDLKTISRAMLILHPIFADQDK